MNNENNNNSNNYVTPEKVDLSQVTVDKSNEGALNRERDNIISASIQANNAIDESLAKDVNNTIKVKKKNPVVSLLIGVFFIALACVLAYVGYRLLETYIKYDDNKHTTTTTTTKKINYFTNYTYDNNTLRKFQNDTSILILMPTLANNVSRYISVDLEDNAVLNQEEGTYNIENGTITLVSDLSTERVYNVEEYDLRCGERVLTMSDQEYKYYVNKTDSIGSILIINATQNKTFAYLYDTNTHEFASYTETMSDITLSNGSIFTKSGNDLTYNGLIYSYVG